MRLLFNATCHSTISGRRNQPVSSDILHNDSLNGKCSLVYQLFGAKS